MTVAEGEVNYQHGAAPCTGAGMSWSDDELDTALVERITPLVFDDDGKADIEGILNGLAETDFDQEGVRAILADAEEVEDWRVGEAIAEAYLTDHRSCEFPWPDGRDERKAGSSLPGADLVGFQSDDDGDCFAFGEVKTSSEAKYPPQVVSKKDTGLRKQIEDLRDKVQDRDQLWRYLAHRQSGKPWSQRFKDASTRYIRNKSDVRLYGFLVRDVAPHTDDLRVRVTKLAEDCPEGTRIELLALYVPEGRIEGLGAAVAAHRKGAVA